jgi:hypothetical protein
MLRTSQPVPNLFHEISYKKRYIDVFAHLDALLLPTRLLKSANEKLVFSHFEAQEVEEVVQAVLKQGPMTTRDGGATRQLPMQAELESHISIVITVLESKKVKTD